LSSGIAARDQRPGLDRPFSAAGLPVSVEKLNSIEPNARTQRL